MRRGGSRNAELIMRDYKKEKYLKEEYERKKQYEKESSSDNNGQ